MFLYKIVGQNEALKSNAPSPPIDIFLNIRTYDGNVLVKMSVERSVDANRVALISPVNAQVLCKPEETDIFSETSQLHG